MKNLVSFVLIIILVIIILIFSCGKSKKDKIKAIENKIKLVEPIFSQTIIDLYLTDKQKVAQLDSIQTKHDSLENIIKGYQADLEKLKSENGFTISVSY
jgi:hypothetical protein